MRKLPVWIETDVSIQEISKGYMFFLVDDTKSFMKPECSVTQSSAMAHPDKWAIADVLSGKRYL